MIEFLCGLASGGLLVLLFHKGEADALRKHLLSEIMEHERSKTDLKLVKAEYRQLSIGLYKAMKEGDV